MGTSLFFATPRTKDVERKPNLVPRVSLLCLHSFLNDNGGREERPWERGWRKPCPTNTHTYTLYSSSFHRRLSQQISFCDPHPTVFLSFSFFLWIQTGFEAKAAFDPSRFENLPTNLPASTSNFTIFLLCISYIAFARSPIFKIVSFLQYLVFSSTAFFTRKTILFLKNVFFERSVI